MNYVAVGLLGLELLILVSFIVSSYLKYPYQYMRTATPYAILYILCHLFRLVILGLKLGSDIYTSFTQSAVSGATMFVDRILEFALLRFIMNAREVHVKLISDSYADFQEKLMRHRRLKKWVYLLFIALNLPVLVIRILIDCNELNDLCQLPDSELMLIAVCIKSVNYLFLINVMIAFLLTINQFMKSKAQVNRSKAIGDDVEHAGPLRMYLSRKDKAIYALVLTVWLTCLEKITMDMFYSASIYIAKVQKHTATE